MGLRRVEDEGNVIEKGKVKSESNKKEGRKKVVKSRG